MPGRGYTRRVFTFHTEFFMVDFFGHQASINEIGKVKTVTTVIFMKNIPYTKKDFSWVRWTVQDIEAVSRRLIAEKKEIYVAVKKIRAEDRTFENTVYALERSNHCMENALRISLLMQVSPDKEIRNAASRALEYIGKRLVDIEYDKAVYQALKEYAKRKEALDPSDQKLFSDMLADFRRRGFEISAAKQKKLHANLKELSKLASSFEKNLNNYHDEIVVDESETAGLGEGYLKSLPRKNGKYVVSLDYPSLIPFMENAESDAKRKELSEKNWRKGGKKNVALLERMVRLREENAKLLGYASHADFQTEDRMADSAEAVFSFLQNIMTSLAPKVKEETEALRAFKRRRMPGSEEALFSHEIAYFSNQLKKEKYDIDDELLREYFPLEHVRETMFSIFGKMFSISFEPLPWTLWHKDARLYRAIDTKSKQPIAFFAFDLFPREGKYGHACVANVVSRHGVAWKHPDHTLPFAALITNFPKPAKARPSLLSHDEVVTLFHEFGHLMHESLSEARHASQSGFSVAWDFVEAPSQMFEFFAWEEKVLKRLSRHFMTGKSLPRSLIRKMIAGKQHLSGYDAMRQAMQALYDMMVHTGNLRGTLPEYFRALTLAHLGIRIPETSLFPAGFGHLAGGYDAGYYGYLWSKVYAADMFSVFRKESLLSPHLGMRYRKEVLAKGASEREMTILRAFLDRAPSHAAFLKDIGA